MFVSWKKEVAVGLAWWLPRLLGRSQKARPDMRIPSIGAPKRNGNCHLLIIEPRAEHPHILVDRKPRTPKQAKQHRQHPNELFIQSLQ